MRNYSVKLLFIFSLFLFLFSSCSSKQEIENQLAIKESINNYMYNFTLENLKNNNGILSDNFKCLLNRYVIKDGIFYSVFELLYPNRLNELNTMYFYDLYNDDCHWVDLMVMELEEQRIASQLLEMEQRLSDVGDPVTQEGQQKVVEENEATIKEYIKNEVMTGDNNLGYMEYGEEKFIPQVIGNNYILIHSYEGNISRNFYDNLFRCYKTENWKISSSNEQLLSTSETFYINNSYIPSSKITVTTDSKKTELFNEKGQLIEEIIYSIYEEKEYIKSKLVLKYNNDNKIQESNLTEYTYKDEKFSKLLYSFNKKYLYKYNNDDMAADFDYYENDVLKMKNRYSSDDTYTSRIYFDDGYNVTTYYQNNMPIKEVFAVEDTVERVKIYEQ